MLDSARAVSPLLLHGLMGGWDELVLLAAGVVLAVIVVKWTNRSAARADEETDVADDEVAEQRSERR